MCDWDFSPIISYRIETQDKSNVFYLTRTKETL